MPFKGGYVSPKQIITGLLIELVTYFADIPLSCSVENLPYAEPIASGCSDVIGIVSAMDGV